MSLHRNTLDFHFRDTRHQSRFSGEYLSKIRTNSGDFHELRPYIFGEGGVRIDYRKSNFEDNELIVREYMQEQSFEVHLAFFIDPSWRFGTEKFTKFDILKEAVTDLCNSIWEQELPGVITLVGSDSIFEYPFPRDLQELHQFLTYFKEILFSADAPTSKMQAQSYLHGISQKKGQIALCLFAEEFDEPYVNEYLKEYQIAQISIIHPEELNFVKKQKLIGLGNLLGKVKSEEGASPGATVTLFGAKIILNRTELVGEFLQAGFYLW